MVWYRCNQFHSRGTTLTCVQLKSVPEHQLTKNFIKDFIQSRHVSDLSQVHSDLIVENPHLLEIRSTDWNECTLISLSLHHVTISTVCSDFNCFRIGERLRSSVTVAIELGLTWVTGSTEPMYVSGRRRMCSSCVFFWYTRSTDIFLELSFLGSSLFPPSPFASSLLVPLFLSKRVCC